MWTITFSDQDGICSDQVLPVGQDFPDFLSISAFDEDPDLNVGGALADKWNIGTFTTSGRDDPRLACLIKQKGDEFVGFFTMSFMYTIVIKDQ